MRDGKGAGPVLFRGRPLHAKQTAAIRRLVRRNPEKGRQELARRVCLGFGWRGPGGALSLTAALALLRRMEARGLLELPVSRRAPRREVSVPSSPPRVVASSGEVQPSGGCGLVVRPILPDEVALWKSRMAQDHYLGCPRLVGESLRYVAVEGQRWLGLVAWGAAARFCSARDRFIGWDTEQRLQWRHLVVNNVRFLVLAEARRPHLASQILGANLRRLSRDWRRIYGHPVLLAETFVDRARFSGTCYRAANWAPVGSTQGWERHGQSYRWHGEPKEVWVYRLDHRALERLRAPADLAGPAPKGGIMDVERLPLEGEEGLFKVFSSIRDPRKKRGQRYRLKGILAMAAAAVASGQRSFEAVAEWAADLPVEVCVRLVGSRRAPEESTFRRVLGRIGMEEFERKVGAWMAAHGLKPGSAVAIDGKTLKGSTDEDGKAMHLMSAMVHESGTTVAQKPVADKTNEIKMVKPLLKNLDLQGVVVTADAMHTQVETARHLVEKKGADYVLIVKANQPTMLDDIKAVDWAAIPPSAPDD